MNILYPVILCGGSGTRLWPMSRDMYPKQFMKIGEHTLFGDTLERCRLLGENLHPIVVCNENHRFYVAATMQEQNITGNILLEPKGRNTAPAIALAAFQALQNVCDDDVPILLVLPSDHTIQPEDTFVKAVYSTLSVAADGFLLTFGITPTEAATGFGYIIHDNEKTGDACFAVSRFLEKPDVTTAEELIKKGNCYWNSGMFLFRADIYLKELQIHAPEIYNSVKAAWEKRQVDHDFLRPDTDIFTACPSDSIDYAVMEKTDKASIIPLDISWSDLGSWEAFYQSMPKDVADNASVGDVILENSRNCYAHSTHRLIVALGLEDISIVETSDAILVAHRNQVQQVKSIVERLKKDQRIEFKLHPKVYRPWGSYEGLAIGSRFQVKRIIVNPGAELSLQKHFYRSEHWVVVDGTAEVTVGGHISSLTENESIYIPLGAEHRLKNSSELPLTIVEVQTGSYLGEDDIVRIEDTYGRVKK